MGSKHYPGCFKVINSFQDLVQQLQSANYGPKLLDLCRQLLEKDAQACLGRSFRGLGSRGFRVYKGLGLYIDQVRMAKPDASAPRPSCILICVISFENAVPLLNAANPRTKPPRPYNSALEAPTSKEASNSEPLCEVQGGLRAQIQSCINLTPSTLYAYVCPVEAISFSSQADQDRTRSEDSPAAALLVHYFGGWLQHVYIIISNQDKHEAQLGIHM